MVKARSVELLGLPATKPAKETRCGLLSTPDCLRQDVSKAQDEAQHSPASHLKLDVLASIVRSCTQAQIRSSTLHKSCSQTDCCSCRYWSATCCAYPLELLLYCH